MKYLQALKLIMSMLPLLIEAIKAAEEAIPGQGKGEAKLAMIRAVLESAYSISTDVQAKFDDVWPALKTTIGAVVASLNTAGVFKK